METEQTYDYSLCANSFPPTILDVLIGAAFLLFSLLRTEKIPYHTETIIKNKKAYKNILESKAARNKERRKIARKEKLSKANINLHVKSMESFIKSFRLKENDSKRLKRVADRIEKTKPKTASAKEELLFVVRVRGAKTASPKTAKILRLLRLPKQYNGVFLKATSAVLAMLKLVEPFVCWGTPTVQNVRDIIFNRSVVNVDGSRVGLTDNRIVEKVLGEFDIICIEDVVNEIATLGPHFKETNKFLWNFKLSSPSKGKFGPKESELPNGKCDVNALLKKMI